MSSPLMNDTWTGGSAEWSTNGDWSAGTPNGANYASTLSNGATITVQSGDNGAISGTLSITSGTLLIEGVLNLGGLSVTGGSVTINDGSLTTGSETLSTTYNQTGNILLENNGNLVVENGVNGTVSGTVTLETGADYTWEDSLASSTSGAVVDFADGSSAFFNVQAAFGGSVQGFQAGNEIFDNFGTGNASVSFGSNSITVTRGGDSLTINFTGGTYNSSNVSVDASTGNITTTYETPAPEVASATYDASTGKLVVTAAGNGDNFTTSAGDFDPTQLTLTGEDGLAYTLTGGSVGNVSSTSFTVTLTAADQLQLDGVFDKNGTSSTGNDIFNGGAGATVYDIGAGASFDVGGRASSGGVTVSNALTPTITSASYNRTTGVLTLNGTGLEDFGGYGGINLGQITLKNSSGGSFTFNSQDYGNATGATQATIDLSNTTSSNQQSVLSGEEASVNTLFASGSFTLSATSGWDAGAGAAITSVGVSLAGAAPNPPVIDGLSSATDSGTSGDNRTDDNQPGISGTSGADDTITIYLDGSNTALGTTVADGSGDWTFDFPSSLSIAGHSVIATATSGGLTSSASSSYPFTIDSIPTLVSIARVGAQSNNASSDSFTVTFSQAVSVTAAKFSATTSGSVTDSGITFTGSGSVYTVTVNGVTGDGTLSLGLASGPPIVNVYGDPLGVSSPSLQSYTIEHTPPTVTAPNIAVSGGTGTGGAFKIGDTVTATWDNSAGGDNNSDTINAGGVTMNFSQFGGGSAVVATHAGGIWTATYTITSGVIDTASAHVAVTATDYVGNATMTSGSAVTVDDEQPVVTAPNIGVSGGTGTGGAFKIGDTVTATWDNSGSGDNNSDTINAGGVTMNFSQFGGGSAVIATNVGGVWTATYTITSGAIDTASAHVAVTATDHVGNATTTSGSAVTVDDEQPVVTAPSIGVSGGTGTGGAFKIGDTVTASWDNSGTGDNNSDTINAGDVTMNFSQFGGGSAVVATNSGGVWTATYTIGAGAIDTASAHVAVTATDHVGNATTTSGAAATVDDIAPVVTAGNIALSGAAGAGGAFKIGDTIIATWNDGGTGDNNTDTINAGGVTMDFSQFGGGSAVVATNVGGVWTATYAIVSGAIDTASASVAVTATDHVGNATTTSGAAAAVDDIAPVITALNIGVSGGTGTGGAFKIGDTVTATWNDSAGGDNNTDPINAGGVTIDFSQFGGGSAVVATESAGVWSATYTIASGVIDTASASVAVTATDHVGNATTMASGAAAADNEQPVVTTPNIGVSGASGAGGAFKIGDTVTATWDDSGAGDNNTDTINAGGVTIDFSQFGGGSAVVATESSGVWSATYTITSGAIDTASASVAVTATDHVGNATTTSGGVVAVDDEQPIVTAPNIGVSGGSGTGGAFKIGDTVTATWDDSAGGDDNTDPINAGGVTMDFSQFGGGSAVVATDNGGVWTATYAITAGAIDTASASVAVTATDHVGNAATTLSGAVTADDEQPIVTRSGIIGISGASGAGGQFRIGDTITVGWDTRPAGNRNTDTINAGGVTMNFSQFGGGSAVVATDYAGLWIATWTITAGANETANAHVAVTVTDHVGNATTASSAAAAVDDERPVVTSITAKGSSPNHANSDKFAVTFSEAVTGVTAADFIATMTGTLADTSVTLTQISGRVYTVTVNGVTGDGTLRLDLASSGAGIADAAGNAISGGFTNGDVYVIAHDAPTISFASTPKHFNGDGPTTLTGTVVDTGGSGIKDVILYNGAVKPADEIGMAIVSGATWSLITTLPRLGNNGHLIAVAQDNAGNATSVKASFGVGVAGAGMPYATFEREFDSSGRQTLWRAFTASGALYLQGARVYLKGGASERIYTHLSGRGRYSSFEVDFNAAGAVTGRKYFYTGVTGQAYNAYEIDAAPSGKWLDIVYDNDNGSHTTKAVATGVTLTGFSGKDIFEFHADPAKVGHDRIKGFDTSKDVIDISSAIYANFKALAAAIASDPLDGSGATSTHIKLDAHDSLLVVDVAPGQLTKRDFAFV